MTPKASRNGRFGIVVRVVDGPYRFNRDGIQLCKRHAIPITTQALQALDCNQLICQTTPMSRHILQEAQIHPAVRKQVAHNHRDIVQEVLDALAEHDTVVVGMSQNPAVSGVRKALNEAGLKHHYLEYGSYFSQWRRRNALKMWTGWPTFPMVFHKGVLLGGQKDTKALIAQGELKPSAQ